MAKQRSEDNEIKKLIEGLYKVIQTTSSQSKEQIRINRELLKVMALLNSGFTQNEHDARELIEHVREGLSINDEVAQKWAKERGATKKDLDEIIKKFRDLEKVEDDIIERSHDYLDLLQDRYDTLDDTLDLSKKLLQNNDQILNAVRKSKEEARKLSGQFDIQSQLVQDMVKKKLDLGDIFATTFKGAEDVEDLIMKVQDDIQAMTSNVSGTGFQVELNFNPISKQLDQEIKQITENINKEKDLRIQGLRDYFNLNTKLQTQMSRQLAGQEMGMNITVDIDTGDIKTLNGILKQGTKEFQDMANQLDSIVQQNNLVEKLGTKFEKVADFIKLGTDRTQDQEEQYQKLLESMGVSTQLLAQQIDLENNNLDLLTTQLLRQKEISKQLSASIPKLQSMEQVVNKIGTAFDYINAILPSGIGEFLGLARVSNDLIQSHKKGVEKFVDELSKGNGQMAAMKSYMQTFGPSLKAALNPLTLMVAGSLLLLKFATGLTQKYKELASDMKVSLGQAKNLLDVQLDTLTSQKNQFATLKDIEEIQSKMIGQGGKVFGLSNKGAKDLSIQLVEVGKYFGYGNDQAVELHKTFQRLGADDKLSLNLQKNLGLMSEMAGLSPQIVSQDLVESADVVATYFAGMPDKAAKAAIQVRRMGMSLQQAGAIAQKMLDLEGFMTDMYELQAMTNGGIDFSKAFDKGLMGDVEGMTKDIMDQIGTMAEFDKMDYLTRSKIAKTLGMSNDELAKSVRLHEDMQGMLPEEQKYLQQNLDRMGDISNLSKDDIKNRLQQLQATDRLSIAWDKIKGVLVKSLIPLVEVLADGIDAISPIIDIIVMGLKGIGSVIKPIAALLKLAFSPLKFVMDQVSKLTGGIDEFGDGISSVSSPLQEILKVSIGILELWAGSKLLKSFGVIKKGAFEFAKDIPIIGGIFSKVFGSIVKTSETSSAEVVSQGSKIGETISNAVQSSVNETKSKIEKTSKDTKLGFFSQDKVKSGFKLFGDIASKTLTAFAIHSASSFLFMKKDGEEKTSEMADNMQSILGVALSGVAPLLMESLQKGVERSLTKRLEKRIEKTFEDPINSASKGFSNLEKPATTVFGKIKNLFSKALSFGGITPNVTGTFDAMKSDAESVIPKVEKVEDVIEKVKTVKTTSTVEETALPKQKDVSKPIKSTAKKFGEGFDMFESVISSAWKGIKTVLTDIVKFVSTSMKELSSGIGTTIKNILKGIGDGLSSFKTSALKGAAALVVLSGALWISSKAVQNFANTKWEDIAKAGVVLGGLTAVAMLLGNVSPMLILASVGLGLLGAALIPTAIALNMFNKVNWSSLAKAGVALVGLGVVGSVLGGISPALLLGSIAIAALGASLIPFAYAMDMFNKIDWSTLGKAGVALIGFGVAAAGFGVFSPIILAGSLAIGAASISIMLFGNSLESMNQSIQNVDLSPLKGITSELLDLASIPILKLFALSAAVNVLGASLMNLQVMSSVSSGISKMFGGNDSLTQLEKLANLADPLMAVSSSLGQINDSLNLLAETTQKVNLDNFGKITKVSLETDVQRKIQPQLQTFKSVQTDTTNTKVSPIQPQVAKVLTPEKKSVAQDKLLNSRSVAQTQFNLNQGQVKNKEEDIYNGDTIPDNRDIELKLDKMIHLLELMVKKDVNAYLDNQKITSKIKAKFNN